MAKRRLKMDTLILRNNARQSGGSTQYTIEVLGGDSKSKDALQEAIRGLEHHPARAPRRSIIDMLTLIQSQRLHIKHVERTINEDATETWVFVLQA
jgi:hypothetical protein